MRSQLLWLTVLVACGPVLPIPDSLASPTTDPDQAAYTSLAAPAPADPPVLERPTGLLAKPDATSEEFADWYRGLSEREIFTAHLRLITFVSEKQQQPEAVALASELLWLEQERSRLAGDKGRVLLSARSAPRTLEARFQSADAEELAWWAWTLSADLAAHRREMGYPEVFG